MKHAVIALLVVLGLSGCDAVNDLGSAVSKTMEGENKTHQMTLVIPSGHKMIVGGQQAEVFGSEECPPASDFVHLLFGSDMEGDGRSCVVISPDTSTVTATVGLPTGASKETWTVERKEDRVMLRRADGSLIGASE